MLLDLLFSNMRYIHIHVILYCFTNNMLYYEVLFIDISVNNLSNK